jgi:hypothetical protein
MKILLPNTKQQQPKKKQQREKGKESLISLLNQFRNVQKSNKKLFLIYQFPKFNHRLIRGERGKKVFTVRAKGKREFLFCPLKV